MTQTLAALSSTPSLAGNFQGTAPATTANDVAGTVSPSSAYNLIGTGGSGGLVNGPNSNQVGVSYLGLANLANNGGSTQTVELIGNSPAIARGSLSFVPAGTTDQRRFAPRRQRHGRHRSLRSPTGDYYCQFPGRHLRGRHLDDIRAMRS